MAEASFWPYGLGIGVMIALFCYHSTSSQKAKIWIGLTMFHATGDPIGMVLLIACMAGLIASIVGVRMYILFKK